jgi:membrane protein
LEKKGLLVESCDEPAGFFPAHDIDTISLKELFDSIRIDGTEEAARDEQHLSIPAVDHLLQKVDGALEEVFGTMTLGDLVVSGTKDPPAG